MYQWYRTTIKDSIDREPGARYLRTMRRGARIVLCAMLLALVPNVNAGDVLVHVVITRQLTKKHLTPVVYNLRGASIAPAVGTVETINEFERTIVMLERAGVAPAPPQQAVIEQHGARFEPDLVAIPAGSTVVFPNLDPIFHNVFSLSKAQPFDLGYYPKDQSRTIRFTRPGVVQVYCHIHSNMYAAIVVTASPWYGKPSGDGAISFPNVAPGHYKVLAWHKVAGMFQTEVEVTSGSKSEVSIRVPVEAEARP